MDELNFGAEIFDDWTGETASVDVAGHPVHLYEADGTVFVKTGVGIFRYTAEEAYQVGVALVGLSRVAGREPERGPEIDFDERKVCFTGVFAREREQLAAEIEDLGGTVVNRIDAATLVVVGTLPHGETRKLRYARRYGATEISEQDLEAALSRAF